jgi:predicted nuclease of restriction endonuclease-like (RecB) superfamily
LFAVDLVLKEELMDELIPSTASYTSLLTGIQERIRTAQVRAAVALNRELVVLYWGIGSEITRRQRAEGWGTKVIEALGRDLKRSFPEMRGLSPRNLKYMKAFADSWPEEPIVQQAAAQLPWFHNCILLDKVKDPAERLWYVQRAIENGWSRNVLVIQIESGLYRRQGRAITNFERRLPSPQSDLAQQLLKDPYNFDFLMLAEDAKEREIESGLIAHLQKFLVELGIGFPDHPDLGDGIAKRDIVADRWQDNDLGLGVGYGFGNGGDIEPRKESAAIGGDAGAGASLQSRRAPGATEQVELTIAGAQREIVNEVNDDDRPHLVDRRVDQDDQHVEGGQDHHTGEHHAIDRLMKWRDAGQNDQRIKRHADKEAEVKLVGAAAQKLIKDQARQGCGPPVARRPATART